MNSQAEFARLLLEWWGKHKRDFPWRRTRDPYAVLVAEMLLRKTTAGQVEKIYSKFMTKYPDSGSLSEADEIELSDLIKPLGMEHQRTKLLIKLGKAIVERYNGNVPAEAEDLLQLPGVGMYAANAVLCFAHSKNAPLVDTNVIRVFQRFFGFQSQKRRPKDDAKLWSFVADSIPRGRARDFNLAVIDHAHSICSPKNPHCPVCPLNAFCKYAKEGH